MCRWIAYTGESIWLEELILRPQHSLIDQSLASKRGVHTTNGDGFGIGWYGGRSLPGVYRDIRPAWNDLNLRNMAEQIRSPMFLAHVRAATGSAIQRTNCHPFRHGRWLMVHNGVVHYYPRVRHELTCAVDSQLFAEIEGTTDSEVLFFLALTFGLDSDPVGALERTAGFVEQVGRRAGVAEPLHMTLGLADGERLIAVRYSSEGKTSSLFHSRSATDLRRTDPGFAGLPDDAIVVVSEPLTELTEWVEVPEGTLLEITSGEVRAREFRPSRA